ncbi:MAG: ABC transporter permease [bacterium]
MRALALARRELSSTFDQPIATLVLAAFLALSGSYVFVLQPFFIVGRATVRPLFEFAPFLFTLFAPAVTMRSLAEERRSGTLEVVLSWPLSDWEVALGKFLAALGLLALGVALTLPYPLTIAQLGDLDWGPVLGGYAGLLLLGGAYLALGLMVSACTSNQIVAFIGGFLLCFAVYLIGRTAGAAPAWLVPIVEGLSFERHFAQIARGVLDGRDVAFFLSVMLVGVGLTAEILGARRWR